MKKLSYASVIVVVMTLLPVTTLHAQFLKNLVHSVKQTAQNKVNNKADQAASNAIDSALKTKGTNETTSGTAGDTAATNKVLNAFSKAVQQNPNDTSAADITIKALGNLVGGGGVSAADSAAAIKSFMTGTGGSGVVYQYITTMTSKKNGTTKDTTTAYLTNSGDGRSEMRFNFPGASANKMISIARAPQPKYVVMLYPDSKTYSLTVIDTSLINSGRETYTVTKVGNEVIQGYPCVHSRLTSSPNSRFANSSTTFDIWTSTAVPGYSLIQKVESLENLKPGMMQALYQAGCGGSFVKMSSTRPDFSMEMLLTKAEMKAFPASMFAIPEGYTESKENMIYHMVPAKK